MKRSFTKRFLSLFLCLMMLVPFAACAKSGNGSNNDASADSVGTVSEDASEQPDGGTLKTSYTASADVPKLKGDVILLQLNNTASFALDYGAMPSLSAFAKSGVTYDNFYAQCGLYEGMYSALTSLYAPYEPSSDTTAYYSLAHLFRDKGYSTSAYLMTDGAYNAEVLGFDTVKASDTLGNLISAVTELADNSRNDFVFAEFANLSYPYIPDSENSVKLDGDKSLNSYLECAAYGDSVLKGLFDILNSMGSKAPTLVIYGTAPELDKDYAVYSQDYPTLFENGFDSADAYKTPFVIYSPSLTASSDDALATVYDIYPTVAALYGFKSSKMLISGDNVYMNDSLPEKASPVASPINLAEGKSYTFAPSDGTDAAYMFPSLGDNGTMLTDGVVTDGKNIPESGCGFVLKQCSKLHYITVDLGDAESFDTVVLAGVAFNDASYAGLSGDAFSVEISQDGSTFVSAQGDFFYGTDGDSVFRSYHCVLNQSENARYVRIGISASSNYLTASEILIYGTLAEEEVSAEGLRFFAIQSANLTRGRFITDAILYDGVSEVNRAYSVATGAEISARPYKELYKYVFSVIYECECAVLCDYFGKDMTYKELLADLPEYAMLTTVSDDVNGGGSMVGHKGFLSNFSYTYTPAALDGKWCGLKYDTNKLVLDNATEGTLITKEFDIGGFKKLYATAIATANGGSIELYASYVAANGVNTRWEKLCTYTDDGFTSFADCLGVSDSDGSAKRFRLMIKLTADESGTSPEVHNITLSPLPAEGSANDTHSIDGAAEVFIELDTDESTSGGVAAVATLVAKALSTTPDYDTAACITGSTDAGEEPSLAALAYYASTQNVYAFADAYGAEEFVAAIDRDQPVIFLHGGAYLIATGYGKNGITAIDSKTGEESTLGFDKFNNTEVLVVDSALYTPEIIDNFISESSAVRPGVVVEKQYIVIHNTGNYSASANASAHDKYIQGLENNPDRKVSWHYTVDDTEIYHHLPDNETAWHAGDGSDGNGNKYGIGIEICVNGFPGVYEGEEYEAWLAQFMKAVKNASYLTAKLMIENNIDIDHVMQHYDFAPEKKNCPMQMRYTSGSGTFTRDEGDMWVYFLNQVEKQYERLLKEGF